MCLSGIHHLATGSALFVNLVAFPNVAYACAPGEFLLKSGERERTFAIELADTWFSRMRGLMGRSSLEDGAGMLFVYDDEQPRTFWMKNTPLSLDLIYFDRTGTIVDIIRGTTPNSTEPIKSAQPAQAVLELRALTPASQIISVGDHGQHGRFPEPVWPCEQAVNR